MTQLTARRPHAAKGKDEAPVTASSHDTGAPPSSSEPDEGSGPPSTSDERDARLGRQSWSVVRRVFLALMRPKRLWKEFDARLPDVKIWHHVVLLASLKAIAAGVGVLTRGLSFDVALVSTMANLASGFLVVGGLALAISIATTFNGGTTSFRRAVAAAAYGLTPLFLFGILGALPVRYIGPAAELVALPYTFMVLGSAVHPLLKVPAGRVGAATGLICGCLMILWTSLAAAATVVLTTLT